MSILLTRSVRVRMWSTALLVLIALGAAGLAVAADRPQNPAQRPELTWRADQQVRPRIQAMAEELALIDQDVVELSSAGRDVLGRLQALDRDGLNAALVSGDERSATTDAAVDRLLELRAETIAEIDEWRLGIPTRDLLDQLGAATLAAQQVSAFWNGLAADARTVGGLVDALLRHDGLVFRATTAGRESRWADALDLLGQAEAPLAEASDVRDGLAANTDVGTLSDLLERFRAYDGALVELYTYVRDTGRQAGDAFDHLQARVDRAQAALPADNRALTVIVGEAAGPSVADALVAIERAHGEILDALDAVAADGQPADTTDTSDTTDTQP